MVFFSKENTNDTRDDVAWKTAEKLRESLTNGAKETVGHYSYVNYAYGGESAEEVYGAHNLERLRKLKDVFDPGNRFRWNANILDEAADGVKSDKDEL